MLLESSLTFILSPFECPCAQSSLLWSSLRTASKVKDSNLRFMFSTIYVYGCTLESCLIIYIYIYNLWVDFN